MRLFVGNGSGQFASHGPESHAQPWDVSAGSFAESAVLESAVLLGAGGNRIGVFLVVSPQKPDQPALHLDAVGAEDAGLVRLVGGLERDRRATPAQPFQGYFFVIDQRDDDGAVISSLAAFDNHRIAIID